MDSPQRLIDRGIPVIVSEPAIGGKHLRRSAAGLFRKSAIGAQFESAALLDLDADVARNG
jgi:hypothetical protein